ncbi:MAG: hypothetical protein K0B06_02760 [Brevefilum sp.]|nr:hypothetical protein [Brevefilum sp.]
MLVDVYQAGLVKEIRRERRLNLPGKVLVNEGQQLEPSDAIAEAELTDQIYMVDIASSLGVEMLDVKHFLVRQPGEMLYEDDVIAQVEGAIPRLVRTPRPGKFAALHQGRAVLQVGCETIQVQAGMYGLVQSIIPEFGATLVTSGLLLQGVWGNGRMGVGELHILDGSWLAPVDAGMLSEVEGGQVVAAGQCLDAEVLDYLAEREIAGLIVESLAPGMMSEAALLPFPVVALQGFGSLPPAPFILELLKPHAGLMICVHAAGFDRLAGERPEAILSLPDGFEGGAMAHRMLLDVGQRVRVFSGEKLGQVGEVTALGDELVTFTSGQRLPAAIVRLGDGLQITVPQQNLVILG